MSEDSVTLKFKKGYPGLRTPFGCVRKVGETLEDVPRKCADDLMLIGCFDLVTAPGTPATKAETKAPAKARTKGL